MCGVVGFAAISLPRCLESAPRLLDRVRLLLHLGCSERSVGLFGARLESGVYVFRYTDVVVMFVCVMVMCCIMKCFAVEVATLRIH